PFYLRSGKKLKEKATFIAIRFKDVPHIMFPYSIRTRVNPNILYLWIQPNEGIRLQFNVKRPGMDMDISPVDMDFSYRNSFGDNLLPDAYERLLLDVINGDQSLFTRNDEIELAWDIVDPIIEGWEGPEAPQLHLYREGSCGPEEADRFISRDGRRFL
ncbi:MAG: glucose-6-phosphate dehydrogenase, partial [bacterium]